MADRYYVPGYGYVTQGSAGTSGGKDKYASGRLPATVSDGSQRGAAQEAALTDSDPSNDPVVSPTLPRPTQGVAFPLSGYGGFGELSGYAYGQRLGTNPDARELFPYGVAFRTEKDATAGFYELTPDYQQWLDNLAEHPLIGTSASSGRMLWERISGLSAERTAMGRAASPQQIAAEIAASLGVSPSEGRSGDVNWSGSSGGGYSSYGGGSYGGGGGGSSSVALTDPTSARGLLLQTMQGVLGRNPTDREYRDFLKTLNKSEMANPRTVEMDGDVAVQSGGIDASVLALDFAKAADDYKATQANKFYNAFMGALGGGVSG